MVALPASPAAIPLGVPAQNRAAAAPAPAAAPAANNAHLQATPPPVAVQPRPEPAPAAPERRPAPATAAPAAAAPAAAAPAAAAQARGQDGGNFRETLWFKKGDVEQMVAEAKAKAAGRTGSPSGNHEVPVEDAKPLEDRYLDDGSVTVEDRKKFSLRAGGTAAGVPAVAGSMPGERMSDVEMINEIGGGKRVRVIAIAGIAVAAVVAVLIFTTHGKGKGGDKPVAAPAAGQPTGAMAKTADEPLVPPPAPKAAEAPAPAAAAPAEEPAEPARAKESTHEAAPATAKARSPKRKPPKHPAGKKKH
jgi:hypothetical protein